MVQSAKALSRGEADSYAFFGKATPHGTPQATLRVTNLTQEKFEELAFNGRPFVVEDGGKGQPFVGWTCDTFKNEYTNAIVKIEYVKGVKATWPITSNWEQELHPIPKADPLGPQYAPWYWGIKGADEPEEQQAIFQGRKSPLPKVQASMRLPHWLRQTQDNVQEVLGSPEFWLSAPRAGATMHMDAHCESTLAIQLSGKRRWRLGWAPEVPNGTAYKEGTYSDGAVYGRTYAPPLEAVVEEGQALFMPSAFLHETTNIGDTCAASLTFQFRDPVPAKYFRKSLRHLLRTSDFEECWGLLGRLAGMGAKPQAKPPNVAKLDRDGDGQLSKAEAATGGRLVRAAHAFYDEDDDGIVTQTELQAGWATWQSALAESQAKGLKRIRPRSFAYVAADEGPTSEL